jgi:hypothetical protein
MSSANTFNYTEPALLPILDELLAREPIFHRPEFSTVMASDYWEVGASGRRYSREFVLQTLAGSPPADATAAGWLVVEPQCRQLGEATYLLTYTLYQGERRTRRSTIWQLRQDGWQILYHQGTVIEAEEDDTAPSKPAAHS